MHLEIFNMFIQYPVSISRCLSFILFDYTFLYNNVGSVPPETLLSPMIHVLLSSTHSQYFSKKNYLNYPSNYQVT